MPLMSLGSDSERQPAEPVSGRVELRRTWQTGVKALRIPGGALSRSVVKRGDPADARGDLTVEHVRPGRRRRCRPAGALDGEPAV